jgi:hypothetical protein
MDRGGGTSQIVDGADFDIEREADIVAKRFEPVPPQQMRDILARAGEIIIDADDFGAVADKPFAKVRADEPSPACDQNLHLSAAC